MKPLFLREFIDFCTAWWEEMSELLDRYIKYNMASSVETYQE